MFRCIKVPTIVLLLSAAAWATTYYASQSGGSVSCGADGTQSTTAVGSLTGTQWAAGNTIKLCGTISASAGGTALSAQGGGSSGNPVTVLWESNGIVQAPYGSPSNGLINNGGYSYITWNGQGVGLVQNTLNGTTGASCPGGTCAESGTDSRLFYLTGGTNNIIENLTIANCYVRTSTADTFPDQTGLNGIYGASGTNYLTVAGNVMHDCGWMVSLAGASNNFIMYNNQSYNSDHGFAYGPSTDNNDNFYFHDNWFHDFANWDDTSGGNAYHHDAIHMWGSSCASGNCIVSGIYIWNNLFNGDQGIHMTSEIYFEEANNFTVVGYNNVFLQKTDTTNFPANGLSSTAGGLGVTWYNNTYIGGYPNNSTNQSCIWLSGSDVLALQNNIASSCYTLQDPNSGTTFGSGSLNHNLYANGTFEYGGTSGLSFATWQSDTGQDASPSAYFSAASSLALNGDGSLQSSSPAIGVGVNLCNTLSCTGQLAALAYDTSAGNTRTPVARPTGSTAWDIGAYQYQAAVTVPAPALGMFAWDWIWQDFVTVQ